jgi:hypothetical protein
VCYGAPDDETAALVLADLRERFVIEEGEGARITWLLNMAIKQDLGAGTIRIDQRLAISTLAKSILTPEELRKSEGIRTPMLTTVLLLQSERTVSKEQFDYLSVVGSLLHIANCTRCDVSYSVGVLSRHALCPGQAHINAAKRVVMYLYNTRCTGIQYSRSSHTPRNVPYIYEKGMHPLHNDTDLLKVFADSDYASDQSRRSTMGMIVMLNGGPIAWASVLGKTISTSSCEAEINAATFTAKESLHISRMLTDLDFIPVGPICILEDNTACIAQANTGLRHVRNAKHYEVKLRFLQQLVVDKAIEFKYCPTNEQLADLFTKPLAEDKFTYFRNQIIFPFG